MLATDDNYDTNVQVVEVNTGEIIADFDYEPTEIAWVPDSTRLAVNTGKDTETFDAPSMVHETPITILNIQTGSEQVIGSDLNINGLAWNPDGTQLAVTTSRYVTSDAYQSGVKIWDVTSRAVIADLFQDEFTASINFYWYTPVWSPDGTRLAIPNVDGSFEIWDIQRQEKISGAWGFQGSFLLAWDAEGRIIAGAGDDLVRTWDAATGARLSAVPGGFASELRWTDDSLLSVVEPKRVVFINPFSGREVGTLDAAIAPEQGRLTLSPNQRYIAYPEGNTIHILAPAYVSIPEPSPITLTLEDAENLSDRGSIREVLWSPDGSLIALAGTQGVWLYDDPTLGQPPRLLEVANGTVSMMRFTPDGQTLVLALANETSRDFGIRLWDVRSGRVVKTLEGHTGPVTALDFSADGHLLATGSDDLTVRLWDMETGELLHVLWDHVESVLSVDFNPDASLLVSAGDSLFRLWDITTGQLLEKNNGDWSYYKQIPRVVHARFTPDGNAVVFYYVNLNGTRAMLRQWSLGASSQWSEISTDTFTPPYAYLDGYSEIPKYDITFTPEGTAMISYAHSDSSINMWEIDTGTEIREWGGFRCVVSSGSVEYSPDGLILATGVTDNRFICDPLTEHEPNSIWLWDVPTSELRAILRGHTVPVDRLAFSPDSRRLVSVSTDNVIRLWDVETGDELRVLTDYSEQDK